MTVEKKFKVTPTESYPLGHAKYNQDASKWGYKFPQSSGTASDIGVYAQPKPTETGEIPEAPYGYTKAAKDIGLTDPLPNGVSVGVAKIKTDGVVTRGNGAAIKGIKARGSMA